MGTEEIPFKFEEIPHQVVGDLEVIELQKKVMELQHRMDAIGVVKEDYQKVCSELERAYQTIHTLATLLGKATTTPKVFDDGPG